MRILFLIILVLFSPLQLVARAKPTGDLIRYEYPQAPRVVAVGDIHGDPHALISILLGMDLMDAEGRWTGGNAVLVLVGDIVGKGDDSRTCLDLLYHLRHQARRAGGAIHLLLGNHEIYYVEGTAHAPSEFEQSRYADFGENGMVTAFGDPQSKYAREVRRRNTFLKIGSTLFVHADLGKRLIEHPEDTAILAETNAWVRSHIFSHQSGEDTGGLVEKLLDKDDSPLNARELANDKISRKAVKAALEGVGASRVVLGHSPTESGLVETRFKERVWFIDTRNSIAMASLNPTAANLSAIEILHDTEVKAYYLHHSTGSLRTAANALVQKYRDPSCARRLAR